MSIASALLAFALLPTVWAQEPIQYLFISQPKLQKIAYMKLSPEQKSNVKFRQAPIDFIVDDVIKPMGLAVDKKTNKLFVADPGQKRILKIQILFSEGRILAGEVGTAAQDVEAKWVAVDGVGNLVFSNDEANLIQTIDAESIRADESQRVTTLYNGGSKNSVGVSSPAGIAVDNFHVLWANKGLGTSVGSLVSGMRDFEPQLRHMAFNTLSAYGVCLGATNLYFTDKDFYVYGLKTNGGPVTVITDKMKSPRGCVWDGDGSVFVADNTGDGIYSFPGNMVDLHATWIHKIGSVADPYGLAVINDPTSGTIDARIMFSSIASICILLHVLL